MTPAAPPSPDRNLISKFSEYFIIGVLSNLTVAKRRSCCFLTNLISTGTRREGVCWRRESPRPAMRAISPSVAAV